MTLTEVDEVFGGALPAMGALGVAAAVATGVAMPFAAGALIAYRIYCVPKQ